MDVTELSETDLGTVVGGTDVDPSTPYGVLYYFFTPHLSAVDRV